MINRWYQEAVIYSLDVSSFQDSDGDGRGAGVAVAAGLIATVGRKARRS